MSRKDGRIRQTGFTLIELAIVLVVLGIITSGIFAGSALIENAKQKRVIGEFQQYSGVIDDFFERYNALPGDMARADEYWGAACGGDALASASGCNGDGDTLIEWASFEGVKAWQHLELSGFLSSLNMSGDMTGAEAVIGVNVPQSEIENMGYSLHHVGNTNYLGYGGFVSGARNDAPDLDASAAFAIDGKVDDGLPGSGGLRATGAACVSGTEYDVISSAGLCALDWELR